MYTTFVIGARASPEFTLLFRGLSYDSISETIRFVISNKKLNTRHFQFENLTVINDENSSFSKNERINF